MGLMLAILGFLLMILLHELGHFWAAKKSWVKVKEFWIWIPPRILTLWKDKDWTIYTLNLLPLGGFVRLKGEDPTQQEEFLAQDSFFWQPLKNKILILIGWILMNIGLAWLLLTAWFWMGLKPLMIIPQNMLQIETHSYLLPTFTNLRQWWVIPPSSQEKVKIIGLLSGWLASKAGLKTGDIILSVNGTPVTPDSLSLVLKDSINKNISITYLPSWANSSQQLFLQCPEDSCFLGIKMDSPSFEYPTFKFDLPQASIVALKELAQETKISFYILKNLFKNLLSFDKEGLSKAGENIHWPVLAAKMSENILNNLGIGSFLAFLGIISLSLAILNLLPIPALDGGRLLSILIQSILRLNPTKYFLIESYINIFFFVLLMILGLYIVYKDVLTLKSLT